MTAKRTMILLQEILTAMPLYLCYLFIFKLISFFSPASTCCTSECCLTEATLILHLQQIQSQGKTSPTGPPKPANKLDNMLGSLQSDLNRLGVQTVAKGVCGACKKPIVGQVMITLNHAHTSQYPFRKDVIWCTY